MKKAKLWYGACLTAIISLCSLASCSGGYSPEDKFDKDGRLILNLKNVYFDTWQGEDRYTQVINEMFDVKVKASNYDYNSWDTMVSTAINGNNITDSIHFNLKAYNFGSTYEKWVSSYKMLKPLPDDMSKWPYLKAAIDKVSNVDKLKVDGKLYGIPILNDIVATEKDFSNFTYVYRRDWAKQIDEANKDKAGYVPVYKEGDVYTWDEFDRLIKAFQSNVKTITKFDSACVFVDEAWGFPSITNFYKDAPHCYTKDSSGKAINAFTSEKYLQGLEKAKEFVDNQYYSKDQFTFKDGKANELYLGGQAAILYDNFSFSNYLKLRKGFKKNQKNADLDDGTAFLKVKGPDGNFALEGTENWFSMTMFNAKISDDKLGKILDILNYLLSEEGTRLAIYGIEGYDYSIVDGKVELSEMGWEKGIDGAYGPKTNGAKYLRYMATLGNDTKSFDPYTEMDAYEILNNWYVEMKAAKDANGLRVVQEPADISWMSTPTKNNKTQSLLNNANVSVKKYCFSKFNDIEGYKSDINKYTEWEKVLSEVNEKLGK